MAKRRSFSELQKDTVNDAQGSAERRSFSELRRVTAPGDPSQSALRAASSPQGEPRGLGGGNGYTPVADLNRAANGSGVKIASWDAQATRAPTAGATGPLARLPVSRAIEESNARILYNKAKADTEADRRNVNDIYSNDFAVREAESSRRAQNERKLAEAAETMKRLGLDTAPTLGERLRNIVTGAAKSTASSDAEAAALLNKAAGPGNDRIRQAQAETGAAFGDGLLGTLARQLIANPGSGSASVDAYQNALRALDDDAAPRLYEAADRLGESAAADISRAQEGTNGLGRLAVNAGVAGAQMVGDIIAGGGNMIPMMIRSFGGGAQEARRKGYSNEQQLALGLTSAATEYFSEKLFGGNPVYDRKGALIDTSDMGLVNRAINAAVTKYAGTDRARKLMSVLGSTAAETLNEGWEEVVSDLLNPMWEQLITGNKSEVELRQLAESWIIGAALGVAGQAGSAVVNRIGQTRGVTPVADAAQAPLSAAGTVAAPEGNLTAPENGGVTARKTGDAAILPLQEEQPQGTMVESERTEDRFDGGQNGGAEALYLRNGGERADGADPGGELRGVEGAAGRDSGNGRFVPGRAADKGASGLTYSRETVSTAALGLSGGLDSDSVYVVTDGQTKATAEAMRKADERGLGLILFAGGDLHTEAAPDGARAYYDAEHGVILARADDPDYTSAQLVDHEIGHDMIAKGEVNLAAVRQKCREAAPGGNAEALADLYAAAYEKSGLTPEEAWEELVCDSLAGMNVFGQVFESARAEYAEALDLIGSAAQETRGARGPPATENAATTGGGAKYSIKQFSDGTQYVDVDVDQELFDGMTTAEMQKAARDIILERFRGKVIGDDYTAYVDRNSAKHYAFPANRRMDIQQKQDKMRASTELDHLVSVSEYRGNVADDGRHPTATGGLDKLDTIFRVNGRLYSAEITALVTDRGRVFYDLTKFKGVSGRETGQTQSAAETSTNALSESIADSTAESKPQNEDEASRRIKNLEDLQAENEELRARVAELTGAKQEAARQRERADHWKGQTQRTQRPSVRPEDVKRLTNELIKSYGSRADAETVTGVLTDAGNYLLRESGKTSFSYDELKSRVLPAARELVQNAETLVNADDMRDYAEIKAKLREKVRITAAEAEHIADFAAWKKKYQNRLHIAVGGDATPMDVRYMELSDAWPSLFPADILAPVDQLLRLGEVLDSLRPTIASDAAMLPVNLARKGADEAVTDFLSGTIGSLGVIGVGAYLMANRDFLGKPIVSAGLQNLEPKDQYTERTSKLAYRLGQAFNASPQKIDYFAQQVLGGWWKYQKAIFPVGDRHRDWTLGVKNTYIKDNQYSNDIVNWIYDNADASAKAKASDRENIDKAIRAKMDDNMSAFYSRYYAVGKNDPETTATRGTRQLVLDMLVGYRSAVDSGALTPQQEAVYQVCREQGDTATYLPSVMNSVVKDGKGGDHALSAVQYVEFQTDYLRLYWENVEQNLKPDADERTRAAVVKGAKWAAKEQALNRALGRIGAPESGYAEKYGAVNDGAVVRFKAGLDLADDDGSLKQDEVIAVIEALDLPKEQSAALFRSRYSSDRNNPWAAGE